MKVQYGVSHAAFFMIKNIIKNNWVHFFVFFVNLEKIIVYLQKE